MISRVAEHCYWMSRYLERAEATARVLDVNHTLLLDFEVPLDQQWKPLLIISGIHDLPPPHDAETVQHYMTWEESNLSSILRSIQGARENARVIREVISTEMWERLNHYYLWMHDAGKTLYERNRWEFYSQIRRINQLIHGIGDGTMSHGEAWEFFQLGKYLERGCQIARIIDVKYHMLLPAPDQIGTPIDNAHWVAILTSCSGYEPYHKQKSTLSDPGLAVADFLIFDPLFPRSVRRCLDECRKAAHAISGRPLEELGNDTETGLAELLGWMDRRTIHELVQAGLHESLTTVVNRIHGIGAAIHRTYFDVQLRFEPAAAPAAVEAVEA